jgi:transposase
VAAQLPLKTFGVSAGACSFAGGNAPDGAFRQLRAFVEYKARLTGAPLSLVDPKNTGRECSCCGHTERANRPSQAEFLCRVCGYAAHVDCDAARNIRVRAVVMPPRVSEKAAA